MHPTNCHAGFDLTGGLKKTINIDSSCCKTTHETKAQSYAKARNKKHKKTNEIIGR